MNSKQKILKELKKGALPPSVIAHRLGVTNIHIWVVLQELLEEGKVEKNTGKGYYRLACDKK